MYIHTYIHRIHKYIHKYIHTYIYIYIYIYIYTHTQYVHTYQYIHTYIFVLFLFCVCSPGAILVACVCMYILFLSLNRVVVVTYISYSNIPSLLLLPLIFSHSIHCLLLLSLGPFQLSRARPSPLQQDIYIVELWASLVSIPLASLVVT